MNIIHEKEAKANVFAGQFARTIRHMTASLGSKNIWMGIIEYEPYCTSNMHAHAGQEEIFYCIQGQGEVIVDGETRELKPGTCVYVPPKAKHQIINKSSGILKVLSAVSPPFSDEQFAKDHQLRDD